MTARVEWLPLGHVTHGYRRVFVVYENGILRHVINFAHMPYESVFRVKQLATTERVDDPSLWWGLSVIAKLVSDGTLISSENPETADDGYLQIRPQVPSYDELLPLSVYRGAVEKNALCLPLDRTSQCEQEGIYGGHPTHQ
ncbi:hypothetical protein SAMN04489725_102209 [Alicyclobacillus hesperidum]|uniref:Uncharacterized protein n=1 Tax=Alicyclobacillus hesperidum TaxID=89784 RepID=A0A1H2R8N2_9BACL|nr:hypothetical protein SAMN04489725_102209 [Alicyclobacillus hesperidum]